MMKDATGELYGLMPTHTLQKDVNQSFPRGHEDMTIENR